MTTKNTARQEQAAALHATLTEQVEALRGSDEWARFLTTAARFHAYSLNNVLLILAQRPDATQVAGFRAWIKNGRAVRKGEKSLRIFAPMRLKSADAEGDETGEGDEQGRLIFRPVPVFDISQTDPIEGADAVAQPDPAEGLVTGGDPSDIYGQVARMLTADGWTITRAPLPGSTRGVSVGADRTVTISDTLNEGSAASTMLHEAAHITLGHCDNHEDYAAHRGAWEVAAESVAYVVGGLLGLDTSAKSVRYVAGWQDGPDGVDAIRTTAAAVLAAVHTITDTLTQQAAAERAAA